MFTEKMDCWALGVLQWTQNDQQISHSEDIVLWSVSHGC